MKKVIIGVVVIALVGFAVYKFAFSSKGENGKPAEPVQQPLAVSKNSDVFNQSFEKMLTAYLELKNALIEYDTVAANTAAGTLAIVSDSLKVDELKGDTTGAIKEMAANYAGTIVGSSKALAGEKELGKKKTEFRMISDALYDLVRTVKYDRQKIYHQHCPMAFNDTEEAWWISTSNKVENPYLGKKHPKYKSGMLNCGDITDSLDFTK
jgi:hypothetical protein